MSTLLLPERAVGRSRLPDIGRQAAWFTLIGVGSTLAYLLIYAGLRNALGAQASNWLAWLSTSVLDTAANRRLTFDATCRVSEKRAQVEGLLIFVLALVFTSAALAVMGHYVTDPSRWLEVAVLIGANLAAGLLRFELRRRWVFAAHETDRRCK